MRRAVTIGAALAVVLGALVLLTRGGHEDPRFAVVFDSAKGLVPGQTLKVAGAKVGRIEAVSVAPGPRARVVMSIAPRFSPLPSDTRCAIRPEGIISENYVACDLGRAKDTLPATDGMPTVPVTQTTLPVSLQDVLNVFSLPTDERIRVMISELGLGTAGRGEDLNAILLRVNPALTQSRRALAIVDTQRGAVTSAITQTDQVLAALAARQDDVRGFVTRASSVTQRTAAERAELSAAVARLPVLLDAARPALASLDQATTAGLPLLRNLRASGVPLDRATTSLSAFIDASEGPVEDLGRTASEGRPSFRAAQPVLSRLNAALPATGQFASMANTLLASTRDTGGLEGLLRVIYSQATGLAGYDGVSHMQGLYVKAFPQCLNDSKAAGCSGRYDAPGQGTVPPDDPGCGAHAGATWLPPTDCRSQSLPAAAPAKAKAKRKPARKAPAGAAPAAPAGGGDAPAAPAKPATQGPTSLPDLLQSLLPNLPVQPPSLPVTSDAKSVLDRLLP